jgi:hypothetical protein
MSKGYANLSACYRALGLDSSAPPSQVKAAYRRLAKMYHPDHNHSPDAEKRYREVRQAYEALREWHLSGQADAQARPSSPSSSSSYSPPPSYSYSPPSGSDRQAWTAEDWATEYDIDLDDLLYGKKDKNMASRIPFSIPNLPQIFLASLKELASVGIVLQALLALFIISASYAPDYVRFSPGRAPSSTYSARLPARLLNKPYKNLVRWFSFISALGVVIMRYYVTLRRAGFLLCASVIALHALAAAALVERVYPAESVRRVFVCFALASSLLAFNPLGALGEWLGFLPLHMFKLWGKEKGKEKGKKKL